MIIKLHNENPELRLINKIQQCLAKGGIIIFPTDSVFAIGCSMGQAKAMENVCRLRNLNPVKANLTFLCHSITQVANYTAPISNDIFRLLKRNTPGPFTFLLNASQKVPKIFKNKKKTAGVRIPQSEFLLQLLRQMELPLMSLSLKHPDEEFNEIDIEQIANSWESRVDMIIDWHPGPTIETAIIDCTQRSVDIVRDGPSPLIL